MKKILNKASNWKLILLSFLASAFCIYLFQNSQSEMTKIMGKEAVMIDMRSGYDLEEVNDFFTSLTASGRKIHYDSTSITDMIFPFAYGTLFICLIAFFMKKVVRSSSNWMYLSLFPILLMIVDFKENLNTMQMLNVYPDLTAEMVNRASKVTDIKSTLVTISMAVPLILAVIWVVRWFLNRNENPLNSEA